MGTIQGHRPDGSLFKKRVTSKTRRLMIREPLATIDVSGIEDAINLDVFEVGFPEGVAPFDLWPLSHLPSLTNLSLELTATIPLDAIAACERLTYLGLRLRGDDGIDLGPLRGHPTLTNLSLGVAQAASLDLGPLASIPRLNTISISGGVWTELDTSPLAGRELENVTLNSSNLSAIHLEDLASPRLRYLSLMEHRFETLDLHALSVCEQLETINLGGNELDWIDVNGIAGLRSLTRIYWPNVKHILIDEGTDVRSAAIAAILAV